MKNIWRILATMFSMKRGQNARNIDKFLSLQKAVCGFTEKIVFNLLRIPGPNQIPLYPEASIIISDINNSVNAVFRLSIT
jgi:hypothetical protein